METHMGKIWETPRTSVFLATGTKIEPIGSSEPHAVRCSVSSNTLAAYGQKMEAQLICIHSSKYH